MQVKLFNPTYIVLNCSIFMCSSSNSIFLCCFSENNPKEVTVLNATDSSVRISWVPDDDVKKFV